MHDDISSAVFIRFGADCEASIPAAALVPGQVIDSGAPNEQAGPSEIVGVKFSRGGKMSRNRRFVKFLSLRRITMVGLLAGMLAAVQPLPANSQTAPAPGAPSSGLQAVRFVSGSGDPGQLSSVQLVQVNPTTAATTTIGPDLQGSLKAYESTFDGESGRLFLAGVQTTFGAPEDPPIVHGLLQVVDTRSGTLVATHQFSSGTRLFNLEFDSTTRTLVALRFISDPDVPGRTLSMQLVRVDPDTAAITVVGPELLGSLKPTVGFESTLDSEGGRLFVLGSEGQLPATRYFLQVIDTRSGALVATPQLPANTVLSGLQFGEVCVADNDGDGSCDARAPTLLAVRTIYSELGDPTKAVSAGLVRVDPDTAALSAFGPGLSPLRGGVDSALDSQGGRLFQTVSEFSAGPDPPRGFLHVIDTLSGALLASPQLPFGTRLFFLHTVPAIRYVALGDSVSAGEGLNYGWRYNFDPESNNGTWTRTTTGEPIWDGDPNDRAVQVCHRSKGAYPWVVAPLIQASDPVHLACTGASARNGVLIAQRHAGGIVSPQQLGPAYDEAKPDVVTMTLGANDIEFADIVEDCYQVASCDSIKRLNDRVNALLVEQRSNLNTVLEEILRRGEAVGRIPVVVLGTYYDPFPEDPDQRCRDITYSPGFRLSSGEVTWLRNNLNRLNQNIKDVVRHFADTHPGDEGRIVAAVDLVNVMNGHRWCSQDPWAFGMSIISPRIFGGAGERNNPSPFHPTLAAQERIGEAMAKKVNELLAGR